MSSNDIDLIDLDDLFEPEDEIKNQKKQKAQDQHNCEVRAVGRNLNQITKQINKGKLKVLDEYIVELIEEVNSKIVKYSNAVRDIIINNKA